MTRIIVSGAAGRMGSRIIELALQDKEIELIGALEDPASLSLGLSITDDVKISGELSGIYEKADVMIEFTTPSATLRHIDIASSHGLAIVIGTTGLNADEESILFARAGNIPCVYSANMSLGVNLLFKLASMASGVLEDYDREIIELHHNRKKDAPSGTAKKLADVIKGGRTLVHGRQGIIGPREKNELGMHAVRAGDIIGEHTVLFAGTGERLELIHRAHSRDTFAAGALKAAKWVAGRAPGVYTMQDVLGL